MKIFHSRLCRYLVALFLCDLLSCAAYADVSLPRLIGNGMVLQRDAELKIWGWADPAESVTVEFNNSRYSAVADDGGNWQVNMPPMEAGGPYRMRIRGKNRIALDNILLGDVWVCSGQSNMEYPVSRIAHHYATEIAAVDNPQIRQFLVPQAYDFNTPRNDVSGGQWQSATQKNIRNFSAVGYFFAAQVQREQGVAVGLINSSLGGSPVEAWLSEGSLKDFPTHLAELQKFKDPVQIRAIENSDRQRIDHWHASASARDTGMTGDTLAWSVAKLDTEKWQRMPVPGYWADSATGEKQGVFWFRKTFAVPDHLAGKPALLELGRIVDADTTFINGTQVGNTSYLYPRRRYEIPAELLIAGENSIAIRIVNERGRGGFVPDKPYRLTVAGETIDLRGDWRYRIGTNMEPLAGQTFVRWKPGGLYNAMLHPLLNYRIKGVLWYQGESNVGRAAEYRRLFPALIRDWRNGWQQGDFPFLFVQLANFLAPVEQPQDSDWAELRDAQRSALDLPDTAMAVIIDSGEWNDIHPLDKKTVGSRLALAARKIAYGDEEIVFSGPRFKSLHQEKNKLILDFAHTGSGLTARGGELRRFAIAGKDRRFVWADTAIKGDTVVVWSEEVPKPVAVRYAWADNPEGANLYNREGLPASPFRTDDW